MKSVDFLIVGGSAAGTTAAETIRNLKPDASISIVTDEGHPQYSRVLIPHYIRGKVDRDRVFLKNPEWYLQNKIEHIKGQKAVGLDASKREVKLSGGETIKYGKLLVAVGGKVIKLNTPGADLENILYMRTVEDADQIIKVAKKSKSAVIIGGGFIGLEFASCFKVNGVEKVTALVLEPYYWAGKLDEASSKVLVGVLEKNGVNVVTSEEVGSINHSNNLNNQSGAYLLKTKNGNEYEADAVGVGIGIKSDFSWLEGSGIKINRALVTNEYLETSLPDIYAAGDCAEFFDVIFERQHIMGNWANATSQGNAVGRTMAEQRTVFETASSYTINFFGPPHNEVGGSCTFIGVTDGKFADEVVARGSVEEGKMTRIFVKTIKNQLRIVGATVINSVADVSPLTTAIKGKTDVSNHETKLADTSFDLRNLIS